MRVMELLSQPDALSLSGNIKDFNISCSEGIRFRLLKDDVPLIDNVYQPDAKQHITISVQNVVHNSLSYTLNNEASYYPQSNLVGNFTAIIGDIQINFSAIKSGIASMAGTAAAFLQGNWLTWQPQIMEVRFSQPQWLTYYNPTSSDVSVIARYYLQDNTAFDKEIAVIAPANCCTIKTQFAYLWELYVGDKLGYIDVFVQDQNGQSLSYTQRYIFTEDLPADKFFLFENSLGGLDCAVFTGENSCTPSANFNIAQYDENLQNIEANIDRLYTQNSGYKTAREFLWLKDFWSNGKCYIADEDGISNIVLKEIDVAASSEEHLKSFSFTYKLSADKGLLNISRSDALVKPLEIKTPEQIFFLAPRVDNFPLARLDEATLLPVQSKDDNNWKKISVGEILEWLKNDIISNDGVESEDVVEALHSEGIIEKGLNIFGKQTTVINSDFLPMPNVGTGLIINKGVLSINIDDHVFGITADEKLTIKLIDGGLY